MTAPDNEILEIIKGFGEIADRMRIVNDAVQGQRADLEARGFSPSAAEVMAAEFYRALLTYLMSN